jgi:hypothetical protein
LGRHNVEVGKYYLAEPRDKNRVSLVCFTFDYLCSQELASSHLAVLTYITSFVAISVEFHRITYSPPSRCSHPHIGYCLCCGAIVGRGGYHKERCPEVRHLTSFKIILQDSITITSSTSTIRKFQVRSGTCSKCLKLSVNGGQIIHLICLSQG